MKCPECWDDGNYTHSELEEFTYYLFRCPKCGKAYSLVREQGEDREIEQKAETVK